MEGSTVEPSANLSLRGCDVGKTFMTGSDLILVGGIPTPLKNMSSSMGRIIPYMKWKINNV
jgi:hypothetical protein